jgi:hypothetical protein
MSYYGHTSIVQEIKARAPRFSLAEFFHKHRSSNVDAHCMARSSISLYVSRHVWF